MKLKARSGTVLLRKKEKRSKAKRHNSLFVPSEAHVMSLTGNDAEPSWMKRQSLYGLSMHDIEADVEIRPIHQRFACAVPQAVETHVSPLRDSCTVSLSSNNTTSSSSADSFGFLDCWTNGNDGTADSDSASLHSVASVSRHEEQHQPLPHLHNQNASSDGAGPAVDNAVTECTVANRATTVSSLRLSRGCTRASPIPVVSSEGKRSHSRSSSISSAELQMDDIITLPVANTSQPPPPPPPPYEASHRIVHLGELPDRRASIMRRKRMPRAPMAASCTPMGKNAFGGGTGATRSSLNGRSGVRLGRRCMTGRVSVRSGSGGTLRATAGSGGHRHTEPSAAAIHTGVAQGGDATTGTERRLIGSWSHSNVLIEALRVLDGANGRAHASEVHTTDLDDDDTASSDNGSNADTRESVGANAVAGGATLSTSYHDVDEDVDEDSDDDDDFLLGPPPSTPPPPPTEDHITVPMQSSQYQVPQYFMHHGRGCVGNSNTDVDYHAPRTDERVPLREEETAFEGVTAKHFDNLRRFHVEQQLLLREQARLQAAWGHAHGNHTALDAHSQVELPSYDHAPSPFLHDNGASSDMDFDDGDTQSVSSLPSTYYPPPSATCPSERRGDGRRGNTGALVGSLAPSRLLEIAAEAEQLQREHEAQQRRQHATTREADERNADEMAALLFHMS